MEDGTLEAAALRWHSDRDGDLGTGSQALVTLSPRRHVIALAVTDKNGDHATASINAYAERRSTCPGLARLARSSYHVLLCYLRCRENIEDTDFADEHG